MKSICYFILFVLFTVTSNSINAQTCEPDEMFADSTAGVYPAPITADNPDGGIDEPACMGSYYEYTLTVIIPDSVTLDIFGQELDLEIVSADVPPAGAIEGLPPGIDYLCMPENCTMPALTSGCLLLYGTVPQGTPPGNYDLSLELNITFTGLGRQTFEFPGTVFPGEYYITVRESDHPNCMSTSATNQHPQVASLYPNPIASGTDLQFTGYQNWKTAQIFLANGTPISKPFTSTSRKRLNLNPGLYVVIFDYGTRKERRKLVVY
jgi:hypothetical protein